MVLLSQWGRWTEEKEKSCSVKNRLKGTRAEAGRQGRRLLSHPGERWLAWTEVVAVGVERNDHILGEF